MPASNSLDYDCDWRFGFNLHAFGKSNVGYLLFWSGCGGLNLTQDITVWNPYSDTAGQTIVTGEQIPCIGLLESFHFQGGAEDPIRMVGYVSKDQAANIRAKLASPLSSTKLKLAWYIIGYDDDDKSWYEVAFVQGGANVSANVDTAKGQVQMFIANTPTRIADTLDIRVYKFEFQVVPAEGATANLEFATGPQQRLVKQWGVASD